MRHKRYPAVHILAGFYYILNDCIDTQCTACFFNYCSAFLWHKTSPSTVQSVSTLNPCPHGKQLEEIRSTVPFLLSSNKVR